MSRILVVDDSAVTRNSLAKLLIHEGHVVHTAPNGREAWVTLYSELPDLIVLDLMMPDVNGFDVVEALTRRPETAGIPILVVTAQKNTPEDVARLNGFVTAIMEKGKFDRARFTSEVRRAMAGRRGAA